MPAFTYRLDHSMADTDHTLTWNYPLKLDRHARRSAMGTLLDRQCCGILFVNVRYNPITLAHICNELTNE